VFNPGTPWGIAVSRVVSSGVCLVVVAVGLLVSGCQPRNTFVAPPAAVVEVALPSERPVRDYFEFTGQTQAVQKVEIRSRVNGYLKTVHFEDGATVKAGELLFTIEKPPFEAKVELAKAELEKAKASLSLAESELSRFSALAKRSAATIQELDVKSAERDRATADVSAAKASLRDTELQLGYTEIRAPFSGRIGRHLVDVGNLVQMETTLLATIESVDPIHIYFTLSERDLLYLSRLRLEGKRKSMEDEPLSLEMGLLDEEGYPHAGTLDFTELGVDPDTGTVMYRGVFPNPNHLVVPGLFARLRTSVESPTPSLVVPERAVGTDQRGDYVLVVDAQNKVEYRPVKLGTAVEGMRVVVEGLKADERIVVNGLQRARPGSTVAPKSVALVRASGAGLPSALERAAKGGG
jgi:RND family efflux transporter MFP subunit